MSWQDAVFSAGSVVFGLALLPSVLGPMKPAKSTSLLTASVLVAYLPAYVTLGLTLSAVTGAVVAALWWVLYFQVGLAERNERGREASSRGAAR